MSGRNDGTANGGGQSITEWRIVYGMIVLAASVLFAWNVRGVLSPFVAYLALIALMSPFAGTRRHAITLLVATALLGLHALLTLGGLLAPFFLAFAIAYILDPAVDRLERRMKRPLAIALLLVPALVIVALLLIVGLPTVIDQIDTLLNQLPEAAERASAWLDSVRSRLGGFRIPLFPQIDPAALLDPERIGQWLQQRESTIMHGGLSALLGVGRGVRVALALVGYLVLTPVLIVYLLRDFDRITDWAARLVPIAYRGRWTEFFREYDRLLSRFLRGQLIEATLVGVLTWLGLLVLGFPYSGLVGVIAGVFNLVPYLGLVASILPVVAIAIVSGSFGTALLKAGIVFAIVQFIDGSVTGPRIVGDSVGLHPIWVMLALAVGGSLFGFVGLLLAMPAAVLIKLLIGVAIDAYRASRFFEHGAATGSGE